MVDLPDKVSRKDYGGMSEILEAIKNCRTPEQIQEFYQRQVSKIKKQAKKHKNGNMTGDPEKYACGNIKHCFDNLEISDKELILGNWRGTISGLDELYLKD